MKRLKVSYLLFSFLPSLLFLQIGEMFFHAFHHPSLEEIHSEGAYDKEVVESPFLYPLCHGQIRDHY